MKNLRTGQAPVGPVEHAPHQAGRLSDDVQRTKIGGWPASSVALHWILAGLVLLQWLTADAVHRTHPSLLPPRAADILEYAAHRYGGVVIGLLVPLQLFGRLRGRMPAPAEQGWRPWLARFVHWGFYAVLLGQAATGIANVYLGLPLGWAHRQLWNAFLVLLALHMAGALYHLARRDGVSLRMLPSFMRGRR